MVPRLRSMSLVIVLILGFARIASAQAPITVPDNSYGPGGSKSTTFVRDANGTGTATMVWKDARGVVREKSTTTITKDGYETDTDEWFDEQGKKTYEEVGKYDEYDYMDYWSETSFVDGGVVAGDKWEWDPSIEDFDHTRWNNLTRKWEPVHWLRFDLLKNLPGFQKHVLIDDSFYVGFAVVLEDGYQSFGTYGINASYLHAYNKLVAWMGDFQWTRGSDDFQTYTKWQFLGGLSLCQHVHESWSITPHLLAGFATVQPSSSVSNGATYESTSAFALALGADIGMRFNKQIEWIGRADWNPTFSDGVQNNFRFSTGIRYTLQR